VLIVLPLMGYQPLNVSYEENNDINRPFKREIIRRILKHLASKHSVAALISYLEIKAL